MGFSLKAVHMMARRCPIACSLSLSEIILVNSNKSIYIFKNNDRFLYTRNFKFKFYIKFIHIIGLLVEPNIFNYKKLLEVNRKATSINSCYSLTSLPSLVNFVNAKAVSGIRGIFNIVQ